MNHRNTFQDALIFSTLTVGLVLMFTVVHFQEVIDGFWHTPSPALAQTMSGLSETKVPLAEVEDEYQREIQTILNRPENLYDPTSLPTPAQAILEGKNTKFLIGL